MRGMSARLRGWWEGFTFAARHPARTMAVLTGLGVVSGLGEAAIVVLVVAVASHSLSGHLPLVGSLPHGAWTRAELALGVLAVLAASHFAAAWLTARTAAESQQRMRRMLVDAYLSADWPVQSRERTGQLQELMMTGATMVAVGTQQAGMQDQGHEYRADQLPHSFSSRTVRLPAGPAGADSRHSYG